MNRREFFKNIMAKSAEIIKIGIPESEMPESELFIEAMRIGIDPATVSPDELKKIIRNKPAGDHNSD